MILCYSFKKCEFLSYKKIMSLQVYKLIRTRDQLGYEKQIGHRLIIGEKLKSWVQGSSLYYFP